MKRIVLFTFAALLLSLIQAGIAHGQSATAKRMDPGWFMDGDINVYKKKAFDAYNVGNYEEAITAYLEVLRRNVEDDNAAYQTACCYGLTGKDTLAALFLSRAWARGFVFLASIKEDQDFKKVRESPVFKAVIDSLERLPTALDSVEGPQQYVPAPALSYYRVKLPKEYNSRRRYPLILCLHGYSVNLDSYMEHVLQMMPDSNVILAALQAPYWVPDTRNGYRWRLVEYGPEQQERSVQMSVDYVAAVLRSLKAKYDPSHLYLMGHSQGAWMTFNTGLRYPKLVDGLISFGGWVDTMRISAAQIENARKLKVLFVHGRNDKSVPFAWAEKSRDRLRAGGVDVTFDEFDGGHGMTAEGVKKAFEWIERK